MIPLQAIVFAGAMVEQLYDSNVMNSRGQDTVTRFWPRVGLLTEERRFTLSVDYRLGLHFYAGGTADSTINHRGALGGKWHATRRLDLGLEGVVLRGDDPVLLDRPGVIIPEGGFFDLSVTPHLEYRATRRLDLGLGYTYRRSRFDREESFDGDEHRVDANAAYRISRRVTGRVLARAQRFMADEGADSAGGGLGVDVKITQRTSARAFGGPLWYEGDSGGWFAGAELARIGERWRAALRAHHDIYGGTSAAEAVWSDSVYADLRLRLARPLDLHARAGAYRGGPAPYHDVNVSGLLAHVDLGWMLGRSARLELYGEHRAQDADGGVAFGDVQRTVAGLRFIAVVGTDISSQGELP